MEEGTSFENPWCDQKEDHNNGNDDDDDGWGSGGDKKGPFIAGSASTPGPSGEEIPMQTMQHDKSGLPEKSLCGNAIYRQAVSDLTSVGCCKRSLSRHELKRA